MDTLYYVLKRLSGLLNVGIFCMNSQDRSLMSYQENLDSSPIYHSAPLREGLLEGAQNQEEPYIYRDEYKVYFACIRAEDLFYLIGPMSLELLERMELHQFYRAYGIEAANEKRLKHFTFSEMLDIVETVTNLVTGREYTDKELIYANRIVTDTKEQEEREHVMFRKETGEEELYHHTYQEERKLLDSVREGRVEDALSYSRSMDADLGKLSKKELNHWKNVAVVAITLCTRAAIDGGISPYIAYQISDFYIQKSDSCTDIARMIRYRDRAVEELTRQVRQKKGRRTSNYVERCKDYVDKNYRKKIYLSDIAENLGLSETYLSRLFKKETGERLQDYIVGVRLEHAANLLKYSKEPISDIAEYVNFPSQSYMGKVFQKKYQMSPKQCRESQSPSEYFDEA